MATIEKTEQLEQVIRFHIKDHGTYDIPRTFSQEDIDRTLASHLATLDAGNELTEIDPKDYTATKVNNRVKKLDEEIEAAKVEDTTLEVQDVVNGHSSPAIGEENDG